MTPTDHMSQEIETTHFNLEVTYDDPNYLTLAEVCRGESPGVNELSFLFVEAATTWACATRLLSCAVPRHRPGFLAEGVAMPCATTPPWWSITTDTMIPALLLLRGGQGRRLSSTGFYGCNDPNLPTQEGGLRQLWFNLVRPLELALHRGDIHWNPNGRTARGPGRNSAATTA